MIDTHCHLDSERFDADRAEVLKRAFDAGVSAIVLPGIGPSNWQTLVRLGRSDPRLWVGLGIHPQLLPELPEASDAERLEELDAALSEHRPAAVGECGLDGPSAGGAPMDRQLSVFRGHVRLARKHGLPLIVHCYRAHPQLTQLLQDEPLPEAGAVLHSYSGGPELVGRYARAGCYFSFAGPVSYRGARKPLAALYEIPEARLVAETDAPDQAPEPHRGERSEPGYVRHVLAAMARALDLPEDVLRARTSENACRLFRRAM